MKRPLILFAMLCAAVCSFSCGDRLAKATPTPQQQPEENRVVSVSGRVVPVRWAALGFRSGGRVAQVHVEQGQRVEAGQQLATLDQAELQLAVRVASEALAAQTARQAQAQATPAPEDVAAAEARLAAAQAAVHNLETAPQPRDLEEARLQVEYAKDTLWATQVEGEAPGLSLAGQKAVRARAAAAEQLVRIAELQYERVKAGVTEDALASARASVKEAQAALGRIMRGPTAEELNALRAAVRGAQVALEQAEWQLVQAQLLAPFACTVTQVSVRAGEFAAPAVPVITVADLSTLRIETTDLDEADLATVQVGQAANLTFDALPNEVLHGRVTRIADMSSAGQGAANFVVVVQLDNQDPRLRWGMSAFVDIRVQ